MNLQSILPAAFAGAWFSRESDKHSDRLWRIVPVEGEQGSIDTLLAGLVGVQHGRMFAIPGLERQTEDGQSWVSVGALMSHQALADDWVVVQQGSALVDG